MFVTPRLEIPPDIAQGLLSGQLVRRGGVIQEVEGPVRAWLRESSLTPTAPDQLGASLGGGHVSKILGFAGSAASIMNLGATVGCGVATLAKLDRIDAKLGRMDAKIDTLLAGQQEIKWLIEAGFLNVQLWFERIDGWLEAEIHARLKSASDEVWLSQTVEPGLPRWEGRLEDGRREALAVANQLTIFLDGETTRIAESETVFTACDNLRIPGDIIGALRQLRVATTAYSLAAAALAELGDTGAAADLLAREVPRLRQLLHRLGKVVLSPWWGGKQNQAWHRSPWLRLVDSQTKEWGITYPRLDRWARRFQPGHDGLESRLREALRTEDLTEWGWNRSDWVKHNKAAPKSFRLWADHVDGIWEDLDRLEGRVAEYRWLAQHGKTTLALRKATELETVTFDPEETQVVFYEPEPAGTTADAGSGNG